MTTKEVTINLKKFIKQEKASLKIFNQKIKQENISLYNQKYFRLLSKAYKSIQKIDKLNTSIRKIKGINRRQMFVTVKSKVKLVSTKIGAIIWLDAHNYIDLIGRTIGDVVIIKRSTFMIAGIY